MPIPTVVRRDDLMAALAPLCELLGTDPMNFYGKPGITISGDEITFTVPVLHEPGIRPESRRHPFDEEIPPHPQGAENAPVFVGKSAKDAELGYEIRVAIGSSIGGVR